MSKHFKENKKDLAYYLTLYKLEGHTTWRANLSQDPKAFDREQAQWATQPNPPKVTETQCLRIDRLTGTFSV